MARSRWPWSYIDIRGTTKDPVDLIGLPYRPGGRLILVTTNRGRQAINPASIMQVAPLEEDEDAGCKLLRQDGTSFDVQESLDQIMGLVEPNYTLHAPPRELPPTDSTAFHLINFDELSSAPPALQAAMYQLILDRELGDYRLPKGASMMGCGNREDDLGHVHRMLSPLASRFVHVDVAAPEAKTWQRWAMPAGISPEVIYFMAFKPELIYTFDPKLYKKAGEYAFACPRTWEKVSNILQRCAGLSAANLRAAVRGAVGQGPAAEFMPFLRVWRDLPHPQSILDDPEHAPLPDYEGKTGQQIALCGAVAHIVEDTSLPNAITYAKRLRMEMAEFSDEQRCAQVAGPALHQGLDRLGSPLPEQLMDELVSDGITSPFAPKPRAPHAPRGRDYQFDDAFRASLHECGWPGHFTMHLENGGDGIGVRVSGRKGSSAFHLPYRDAERLLGALQKALSMQRARRGLP